ncbi:hypothetical protein SAMN05216464_105274 [Mucilaginibacter pineti]|uniref:Lipoprotein n=1 Tax=Mucilaginibacter pineti TaxID=1391627 RepID=A0A1G7C3R7_9SPHI|nr:hypothetical protein [Mucilaginibacter pineti]SDE33939.1 hypothetical protein SAMN05216464_105274 [Mucilaginibacter pineti]
MKYLIIGILALITITACTQPDNKNAGVKKDSLGANKPLPKAPAPVTDSAKLMHHLDSLPPVKFPYLSEWYNRTFPVIDLSEFKVKKLFDVKLKLIPTQAGGGAIDYNEADTTFNLTDSNYKAQWNLIAKTPRFMVVEVYGDGVQLVTLTYKLKVIDAINSAAAQGNNHWNANRQSVISKNLTIVLQHEYSVQVDDENHFDTETEEEQHWFINKNGYFREKINRRN